MTDMKRIFIFYYLLMTAGSAWAVSTQPTDEVPKELREVGVVEQLNDTVPLDTRFVDSEGNEVVLGDYFNKDRPVILTFNYYRCPMLCTLQLNGLIDALRRMEWQPGEQFEIVTISIDPRERKNLARIKKQNYMKDYGRPSAAGGWHFLISPDEEQVKAVAETVGFHYQYDEETDQYAHPACAVVCTPKGRISRYLNGVMFDPRTLRLALVEAGEGNIGSAWDQALLFCYQYDPTKGAYTPAAWNLMRLGGGLTVVILGIALVTFWRRDAKRNRNPQVEGAAH